MLFWSSKFRKISAGWRVAILVVAIVAVLAALGSSRYASQAKNEVLYQNRNLSTQELNRMTAAFAKAKLSGYSLVDGKIHVPVGQADRYLQALADSSAYPRAFDHKDAAIQSTGLLERESERRSKLLRALEQDLAFAIRTVPEIDDAYVHYDEIEERGLKRSRITTASVCILPKSSAQGNQEVLSRAQVLSIRKMVASARAGMEIDDVNLTVLGSGRSYGGAAAGLDKSTDRLLLRAQEIEETLAAKVRAVLRMVPQAEVVVGLQLPEKSSASVELLDLSSFGQVAISVIVPRSYYASLFAKRQREGAVGELTLASVTADADERIRTAIRGALPDDHHQLNVTVTPFDDLQTADAISARQILSGRLRNWSAAVALVIAALGVLGVQLISRKQAAAATPHRVFPSTGDSNEAENVELNELDEDAALRETLTDLVREDPDHAARVLNQWIAKAG